jgi:hypothetical protein
VKKVVEELVRALSRFIARELVYVMGGASVVGSFLLVFGRLPSANDHIVLYLLLAAISYVVGYVLQDAFCLLPILPTEAPKRLNWYGAAIYKLYARRPWRDIPAGTDFEEAEEALKDERQIASVERIIFFQIVGTAIGPCWFVCAVLFFLSWGASKSRFELALAVAALAMAVLLGHLAWVKAGQQAQYLYRHRRRNRRATPSPTC